MARLFMSPLLWALLATGQFSTEEALRDHLLSGYDVDAHPDRGRDEPTNVAVQVHFAKLWEFDQKKLSFKADIYLRERWNDTRLAYAALAGAESFESINLVEVEEEVWSTKLFFPQAITNTRRDILFYVDPNGAILRSRRLVLTLKCHMYFARFPFDVQDCPVRLEPWNQPSDVSRLISEADSGIDRIRDTEWANFRTTQQHGIVDYGDSGFFSWASVFISMDRVANGWIKDSMLPAILFVLVANCSFWINPSAVPARVGLSVITVLITTSLWSRILSSMPLVTYRVWMSDYIFGCLIFNIVAFFSYTFVNFGMQRKDLEKALTAERNATASAMAKKDFHERTNTLLHEGIKRASTLQNEGVRSRQPIPAVGEGVPFPIDGAPPQPAAEEKAKTSEVTKDVGLSESMRTQLALPPVPPPSRLTLLVTVDWHMRWVFPLGFFFYNICMFTFLFDGYPLEPEGV